MPKTQKQSLLIGKWASGKHYYYDGDGVEFYVFGQLVGVDNGLSCSKAPTATCVLILRVISVVWIGLTPKKKRGKRVMMIANLLPIEGAILAN